MFPMEAKVSMEIAKVDGTSEFPLDGRIQEEHLNRMRALSRTVELGKLFFPRCSEVLNRIMDADDLSQLAYLGNDTPEERLRKRRRYTELQESLSKAFNEDKEELGRSAVASSSSTKSTGKARANGRLIGRGS